MFVCLLVKNPVIMANYGATLQYFMEDIRLKGRDFIAWIKNTIMLFLRNRYDCRINLQS